MGQFPSKEEILAAVDGAGWLLEQQAIRTLDAADFNPRPSWAFRDPDDPKVSRELDVSSFRQFFMDRDTKVTVEARILVECKQSENPFCAVGQELPEWRQIGNPTEHTLPARYMPKFFNFEDHVVEYGYTWDVLGFRAIALRNGQNNFRATQLTRMERTKSGTGSWSASNAGIFTSLIYPLAKAVRAQQKNDKSTVDDWGWDPVSTQSPFQRERFVGYVLRFPVVLIGSPLYVIDASTDTPSVNENAKWVRVQRHLESDSVKGHFEFDVVNRNYFVEYIDTVVNGLADEMVKLISGAPLKFTGEQFWPAGIPEEQTARRFPSSELA